MLLGAALRQNSLAWNTASWPGSSSNGLIRVVVGDGFNTGQDQSNALYVNCGPTPVVDTLGRLWRPDGPFLVDSNSNLAPFSGFVDNPQICGPGPPPDCPWEPTAPCWCLKRRSTAPPGSTESRLD